MSHGEHNHQVQTLLLVAILVSITVGLLVLGASDKPSDVLDRMEKLEKKLEIVPEDVLREVIQLRMELGISDEDPLPPEE